MAEPVITNRVAAPAVILNEGVLVAGVNPVAEAVSVYPMPALSILTLAKDTTPEVGADGLVVADSVPEDGLVPMARVTELAAFVTVLPY